MPQKMQGQASKPILSHLSHFSCSNLQDSLIDTIVSRVGFHH